MGGGEGLVPDTRSTIENIGKRVAVRRVMMRSNIQEYLQFFAQVSRLKRAFSYSVISELCHRVGPPRLVPRRIQLPTYGRTGKVPPQARMIEIKTTEQIEAMRKACRVARKVLSSARDIIKVGTTTDEIDQIVHHAAIERDAYPSPLNYIGFPKSVCTSVNNVAVHGIPDSRPLEDGDIISVDVSVYTGGVHGDMCETYAVGNVDRSGHQLIHTCQQSLYAAIAKCRPGARFSVIGNTISSIAEQHGFSVSPHCNGHGIGSVFHALPDVIHVANNRPGKMEPGMTFTIEPVLCEGSAEVHLLEDRWTVVTVDDGRTAQFEHTVMITDDGVEVLTEDNE